MKRSRRVNMVLRYFLYMYEYGNLSNCCLLRIKVRLKSRLAESRVAGSRGYLFLGFEMKCRKATRKIRQ
jgi:hypothetical protein